MSGVLPLVLEGLTRDLELASGPILTTVTGMRCVVQPPCFLTWPDKGCWFVLVEDGGWRK
ncbi:MAG TPA: hypothetical protein VNN62_19365 [Methylomirabilota bacterium]|nr:hypothetical protein [Methylomirabilota bacterium]